MSFDISLPKQYQPTGNSTSNAATAAPNGKQKRSLSTKQQYKVRFSLVGDEDEVDGTDGSGGDKNFEERVREGQNSPKSLSKQLSGKE